jgi:hypothetical protein
VWIISVLFRIQPLFRLLFTNSDTLYIFEYLSSTIEELEFQLNALKTTWDHVIYKTVYDLKVSDTVVSIIYDQVKVYPEKSNSMISSDIAWTKWCIVSPV